MRRRRRAKSDFHFLTLNPLTKCRLTQWHSVEEEGPDSGINHPKFLVQWDTIVCVPSSCHVRFFDFTLCWIEVQYTSIIFPSVFFFLSPNYILGVAYSRLIVLAHCQKYLDPILNRNSLSAHCEYIEQVLLLFKVVCVGNFLRRFCTSSIFGVAW